MGLGFRKSYLLFKQHSQELWLPFVVELGFFVIFGFFAIPLRQWIFNNLLLVGDQFITSSSNLEAEFAFGDFPNLANIFWLLLIFLVLMYIVYSLVQGFLWVRALDYGKMKDYSYIKKFFRANIFWMILFIIYGAVSFIGSYVDTIAARIRPDGISVFGSMAHILFIIILYFALPSYVFLKNNSVAASIKKGFRFGFSLKGLRVLLVMILFGVVYTAVGAINLFSYEFFLAMGIFVIPVALFFSRLWIGVIVHDT